MRIHRNSDPSPTDRTEALHVYNALDCCITLEVLEAIEPQLDEITGATYKFARQLQAPILEMELRGIRVNRSRISSVQEKLLKDMAQVQSQLDELCREGLGIEPLNPRSPKQMNHFFYEVLGLPPVKKRDRATGKYVPSTDRKALEKLRGYFYAEPFVNHILAIRDISKKLGVLKTGVDPDGRMRTSYNIGGTDTGRLNSHESAFGSGTNLQNITAELREIFEADKGKRLAYIDLEQAESRAVGAIIWNLGHRGEIDVDDPGKYLDFCESGDLHTNVAMMTFRDLPWVEDMKANKEIANGPFYRGKSYRDASKTLGHGSNYYGKPPTMAVHSSISVELVKGFQDAYFSAFPGIPAWHAWVRSKLIRDGWITNLTGRRRHFFGRRYDDETLRQAIAYDPQGAVGDIMNRGLYQVWKANLPSVELMLQVHDAVVLQYDEEREDELLPRVLELLQVEVPLMRGRTLRIPTEAMVGWNWGYKSERNSDGLIKYKPGADQRRRSSAVSFMDNLLSRTY